MSSGTVVPPLSLLILLYSLVLTVEGRVWSYEFWYCGAPSIPLHTAVYSRLTVEWRVLSYGV